MICSENNCSYYRYVLSCCSKSIIFVIAPLSFFLSWCHLKCVFIIFPSQSISQLSFIIVVYVAFEVIKIKFKDKYFIYLLSYGFPTTHQQLLSWLLVKPLLLIDKKWKIVHKFVCVVNSNFLFQHRPPIFLVISFLLFLM